MSKIIFNRTNIKESLKRGLSLVLTLATIGSFSGCAANEFEDTSTSESTIIGTLLEDDNIVYDFVFNDDADKEIIEEVYDWSELENIIRTKEDEAWYLMYSSHDEETGISENRYAAMLCEDKNVFGNTYYRIVDVKEKRLLNDKFGEISRVDDNTLIFCNESAIERNSLEKKYVFTIFNQITGEKKNIEALNLTGFEGFIIKTNYENVEYTSKLTYELLNSDGSKATDVTYDNRQFDYETGILYLTKDGVTEAIDTKTKKARKIEGSVEETSHGYVSVINKINDKTSAKIIYLMDVDEEPIELMSYESSEISIGVADSENPMFVVMKYNHENSTYDCLFVDKGNNILTQGDYNFVMRDYETDMVKGFKNVKLGDKRTYLIDLVDGSGNIVVDDATHSFYSPISGTKMAIVKPYDDSDYGIVDFDGNYVIRPQFDELFAHPIYQNHDDGSMSIMDCFIIARNEFLNKTTVYTTDFDIIADGDLGLLEAEAAANKSYSDKVSAKKNIKEN